MKKIGVISALTLVTVLLVVTIVFAIHQTQPAETQVALPGPNASSLYTYITVEDDYSKWSVWPGKGKKIKARAPLGIITTYVNENALYSIKASDKMVNGSIIVTENYNERGKLLALFVMYKIKGYNPSAGDWFWVEYNPKGKPIVAGRVDACIKCHSKKKDNDYVFTEDFVK